jgi:glyoxylase-like metal-dependent hydrolase (beta-lactamase superfamily II)
MTLPHLRLFEPAPGILAWYDGRVPGYRVDPGANWVDDGAIAVGIAAYAIVGGDEAIVYDTHVSLAHAARMRADLMARGVARITVVLSHWHLDHVAGTGVFADCPVIANVRTAAHLAARRAAIEAGTSSGPPAIRPLILPTRTFDHEMDLTVGGRVVRLIALNIHSDDATVIWLPDTGLLLAGDTLEDPVTYVAEAQDLPRHLADLQRLAALNPLAILPNHGDPARIAGGGYDARLIGATERYVRWLLALRDRPDRAATPLAEVIAADLASGALVWSDSYDEVQAENVARVLAHYGHD